MLWVPSGVIRLALDEDLRRKSNNNLEMKLRRRKEEIVESGHSVLLLHLFGTLRTTIRGKRTETASSSPLTPRLPSLPHLLLLLVLLLWKVVVITGNFLRQTDEILQIIPSQAIRQFLSIPPSLFNSIDKIVWPRSTGGLLVFSLLTTQDEITTTTNFKWSDRVPNKTHSEVLVSRGRGTMIIKRWLLWLNFDGVLGVFPLSHDKFLAASASAVSSGRLVFTRYLVEESLYRQFAKEEGESF